MSRRGGSQLSSGPGLALELNASICRVAARTPRRRVCRLAQLREHAKAVPATILAECASCGTTMIRLSVENLRAPRLSPGAPAEAPSGWRERYTTSQPAAATPVDSWQSAVNRAVHRSDRRVSAASSQTDNPVADQALYRDLTSRPSSGPTPDVRPFRDYRLSQAQLTGGEETRGSGAASRAMTWGRLAPRRRSRPCRRGGQPMRRLASSTVGRLPAGA